MLTLLEAAKYAKDPVQAAVMRLYAESSDILRLLPFINIKGNAYMYNQEETLPGIAFRGVNESYSPTTSVVNPVAEKLKIVGGETDVDRFLIETEGSHIRSEKVASQVKALGHAWGAKIIKGSAQADAREISGLQERATGTNKIAAGATAGGDALSLRLFRRAMAKTVRPNAILMNTEMLLHFTDARNSSALGGSIQLQKDDFGRESLAFAGVPIITTDGIDQNDPVLKFDEANPNGGSNVGTSIYILSIGTDRLTGIQNGSVKVDDLGWLETKPAKRTRVEWYAGIALKHPHALTRVWGIKDAALVA